MSIKFVWIKCENCRTFETALKPVSTGEFCRVKLIYFFVFGLRIWSVQIPQWISVYCHTIIVLWYATHHQPPIEDISGPETLTMLSRQLWRQFCDLKNLNNICMVVYWKAGRGWCEEVGLQTHKVLPVLAGMMYALMA